MSPKLDLYFPNTHNLKTLGVVDISSYPSNFKIITPTIEIIPPSFTKAVIPFHTSAINMYNSGHLKLSCNTCDFMDLPDGIWQIRYSVAPFADNFVEKTFLRIDALKREMEDIFLCTDITECDGDVKEQKLLEIGQIEVYIEGAIAAANKCNNILAMKLYGVAKKMIDNLKKKC